MRTSHAVLLLLALVPTLTEAHSFGTPYVPPIPLWLYVYGGAATLIVTFLVLGIFIKGSRPDAIQAGEGRAYRIPRALVALLRLGAVSALFFTLVSGFIGTQDAAHNPAMILFWVIFLLAFAYLTLVIGDLYEDEPFTNAPGSEFRWHRARMLGGRTNHYGRHSLRYGPDDFKGKSVDGLYRTSGYCCRTVSRPSSISQPSQGPAQSQTRR